MKATLFLALVASVTGVILRGPSVVSDTYIRNLYATWNLNAEPQGWWDGPLAISATQVISFVTTDTSALLIKFDLSSFVGRATLMPGKPAWLNYFVSDAGNVASLRELVVPWNEVRSPTAKTRALPSQPRAVPWLRPLPADASLSAPPCFRQSTVTWNNLPFASSSWSSTNVPSGTTGTFPGVLGWNRFDVNSSVAARCARAARRQTVASTWSCSRRSSRPGRPRRPRGRPLRPRGRRRRPRRPAPRSRPCRSATPSARCCA